MASRGKFVLAWQWERLAGGQNRYVFGGEGRGGLGRKVGPTSTELHGLQNHRHRSEYTIGLTTWGKM